MRVSYVRRPISSAEPSVICLKAIISEGIAPLCQGKSPLVRPIDPSKPAAAIAITLIMKNRIFYADLRRVNVKYTTVRPYATFLKEFEGHAPFESDFIQMESNGRLTIKTGFMWDGPSGPTVDDKTNMRAAAVHDALYRSIVLGHIDYSMRKKIDKIFHRMLIEDGMGRFRARYYYLGVRWFGGPYARVKPTFKKIRSAP